MLSKIGLEDSSLWKKTLVLIFLDLFSLCSVGALSPLNEKHPSTTSKNTAFEMESKLRNRSS